MKTQRSRARVLGVVLLGLSAALVLLGAGIGSTGFESVFAAQHDPVALQIVWDIRLPRTLGAWLAGALLGLAGAVAQGLFRNPLADPYLLGSACHQDPVTLSTDRLWHTVGLVRSRVNN